MGEGGGFISSPWGHNGKIFCLHEEEKTFVIRAGEEFELLGTAIWWRRRWLHPLSLAMV